MQNLVNIIQKSRRKKKKDRYEKVCIENSGYNNYKLLLIIHILCIHIIYFFFEGWLFEKLN